MMLLALIAALSLATIPISLGWRRTASEAEMAHQLGLPVRKKRFSPERFTKQTGTNLTFNQLLFGFLAWTVGGLLAGMSLGFMPMTLFAIAGGLLYWGSLAERRQAFRMSQAKDILRGLGVIETLLKQGRSYEASLDTAAQAVGPAGKMVLSDLVIRLRNQEPSRANLAVQEWTQTWDNPAVDIMATALLTHYEERKEIAPLIANLRKTLMDVVEVLSRARASAKGTEWQARFLALFPSFVLVAIALTTPEAGADYAANPIYILPTLLGSGVSYYLSMRMIRSGLSIEASMGLMSGENPDAMVLYVDRLGERSPTTEGV